MIPDMGVQLESRSQPDYFDIKTIGHTADYHKSLPADVPMKQAYGRVVQARAARVSTEYERKARQLDEKLVGPVGEDQLGPLGARLQAIGGVKGLAFGAYGEASKGIGEFLHAIAKDKAATQWQNLDLNGARDLQVALAGGWNQALTQDWLMSHMSLLVVNVSTSTSKVSILQYCSTMTRYLSVRLVSQLHFPCPPQDHCLRPLKVR
jgi:hypothetical protein